jgi:hypothetical protein
LLISGPLAEFNSIRTWFLLTSIVFAFVGVFILGNADVRNIESRAPQKITADA